MTRLTRRTLVAGAAGAGAAIASGTTISGDVIAAPAVIRAQNAPVEIVFSNIWGTPPGGDVSETKHPVDQVIEAFNAQSSDVKVTGRVDGNYYDGLQKAQAELAAGDPPALVITPWSQINYADEGLGITNLEDVAGDEVAEVFAANLNDQVLPLVQIDGKTKGVPYAFSTPVIYYNGDVFAEAGVDPDVMFESWASVEEEGLKVQAALDGNPVWGVHSLEQWPAQSLIQSNGGRVMNDEGLPAMDSPEAVEAMQMVAAQNALGLYDSATQAERRASFLAQSTAMAVASIAGLSGLRNNAAFDLRTYEFPPFAGKQRLLSSGGSFIGMYAREEEQQQAAWEFLKFALSEEGYAIWMQTGYLNVTKHDLPILEGQEPAYVQLEEGLTRETPWPTMRGGELLDIWQNYVARMWSGDIDPEEGCKLAAEEINSVIESVS